MIRLGEILFSYRSITPIPIVLVTLWVASPTPISLTIGITSMLLGEGIRLWSVQHIGPQSRRRTAEIGLFCIEGPYKWVRNPLYIGNAFIWLGYLLGSGTPWAPSLLLLLIAQYLCIVPWEEQRLLTAFGKQYESYMGAVNRWLPSRPKPIVNSRADTGIHGNVLRQERSTILAILILYGALFVKWMLL